MTEEFNQLIERVQKYPHEVKVTEDELMRMGEFHPKYNPIEPTIHEICKYHSIMVFKDYLELRSYWQSYTFISERTLAEIKIRDELKEALINNRNHKNDLKEMHSAIHYSYQLSLFIILYTLIFFYLLFAFLCS